MPTTANRGIRYPLSTDTPDVPRDIGYLASDVDALLAGKRAYVNQLTTVSLSNGGTIGTLVIAAQTYASRVFVDIAGMVGFSASANQVVGVNVAVSAGTLTQQTNNGGVRCAEAGQWYGYASKAYVDLAAATATTITFTLYVSGGGNAYFRGDLRADVRLSGEY